MASALVLFLFLYTLGLCLLSCRGFCATKATGVCLPSMREERFDAKEISCTAFSIDVVLRFILDVPFQLLGMMKGIRTVSPRLSCVPFFPDFNTDQCTNAASLNIGDGPAGFSLFYLILLSCTSPLPDECQV
ncbi:hypothetical protein J3F83DRAFT_266026 [Trichoderma novae-zelandiae]